MEQRWVDVQNLRPCAAAGGRRATPGPARLKKQDVSKPPGTLKRPISSLTEGNQGEVSRSPFAKLTSAGNGPSVSSSNNEARGPWVCRRSVGSSGSWPQGMKWLKGIILYCPIYAEYF